MRVLIDECLPAELRDLLAEFSYECETVRGAGLGSKKNGELLTLAEGSWDVLVTSDKSIRFQQNMAGRKIAVLMLRAKSTRIADLIPLIPACAEALELIRPGEVRAVGEGRGRDCEPERPASEGGPYEERDLAQCCVGGRGGGRQGAAPPGRRLHFFVVG